MGKFSFRFLISLVVAALAVRAVAQPRITKQDIDRQQQELNKDRWQYIRDSLDLQKRANQELQRQKDDLIHYLMNLRTTDVMNALDKAVAETSPLLKIQSLFEDQEIRSAFRDALHGDLTSWYKTIGKRAAEEITSKLSEQAPAWADPDVLQRVLDTASKLISMNSEAKQLDRRVGDLQQRQTTIAEMRTKLVATSNVTDPPKPPPPPPQPKDHSALDQTVTRLDRWLALGDRAFDKAGGHDQDAEDQFFRAFPELAMCAQCRRAAMTGSPATEVGETFKDGPLEALAPAAPKVDRRACNLCLDRCFSATLIPSVPCMRACPCD